MIRALETLHALGALDMDARLARPIGTQVAAACRLLSPPGSAPPLHLMWQGLHRGDSGLPSRCCLWRLC